LQLCHVTVVGTLPPFRHASITGCRALPHSVGALCETVDLRVLLHNRVRYRGLAFPPNRRSMLPWASDPRQGSPAIPCSRPKMAAGREVFSSLLEEAVGLLLCRENDRFGYGSRQVVETSCVPRRPGSLSTRRQSANQSAAAVVPGPSSLRPLSPRGGSKTGRSKFCHSLSQGSAEQQAASPSSQQSFVVSTWRRSAGHDNNPKRGTR
jgi:hypothetical protein